MYIKRKKFQKIILDWMYLLKNLLREISAPNTSPNITIFKIK